MKQNGFTRRERGLFAGCYYTFFINGMLALSLGAMLPYLRESYGIGYQMAGLLLSAHSVGNLVSSFIAGVLPLYIGRTRSAALLSLCGVAAFVLMVSTGQPALLILAFFLTGIARGNASNVNNTVINDIATGKAWALNLLHALFSVGAFLSPFMVLGFTAGDGARWRWAALTLAFCCASQAVVFYFMKLTNVEAKRKTSEKNSFAFLRNKHFLVACGILFFYLGTEQGINGWLVTYFKDSGIMTDASAQSMASILWLFVLAGRLLCAALSARVKKSRLLCASAIGYMGFFALLLVSRSLVPATIGIIGLGFCMAGLYPTTIADVGDSLKQYPLAMSTLLTIVGLGGILMPLVVGMVAERVGIIGGMSTLMIAALITVAMIFTNALMKRTKAIT